MWKCQRRLLTVKMITLNLRRDGVFCVRPVCWGPTGVCSNPSGWGCVCAIQLHIVLECVALLGRASRLNTTCGLELCGCCWITLLHTHTHTHSQQWHRRASCLRRCSSSLKQKSVVIPANPMTVLIVEHPLQAIKWSCKCQKCVPSYVLCFLSLNSQVDNICCQSVG